jgi:hypothetical protein
MKAWNALATESVHPNGFLGYVQGTGKEPKDSQPLGYDNIPNYEDFGLGCFLLAGSEVYKLNKSLEPKEKEPKAEKPGKAEKSEKNDKGTKVHKGDKKEKQVRASGIKQN